MSNHLSGANLKFPEDDARLDLTDVFAFVSPQDPSRTVLIFDVDPFLTAPAFHPNAVYRLNVDADADAVADLAFAFTFSDPVGGPQTATVHRAIGADAAAFEPSGEIVADGVPVSFDGEPTVTEAGDLRLFVGVRSDPFFADIEGVLHDFQLTGADAFGDKNVLSMAIEAPSESLGAAPAIGIWAQVLVRRDNGTLEQVDRGGHPSLTAFFNAEEAKIEYNANQPADDVAHYQESWVQVLQQLGGYSAEEAATALQVVLPDILRYDRAQPAAYPNGRVLTDDVFDARLAFVTKDKVTGDGVGHHADLLDEFPFVGNPH